MAYTTISELPELLYDDVTSDEYILVTNAENVSNKLKLESVAIAIENSYIAELDVRDTANRARANHTGTQTASTISDFSTTVATLTANKVEKNPNITAGTNTKITYDAKGLVTAGTILASTDIPVLDTSKITTGILPVLRGGSGVSTSTGTGNNVLSISPVLTTPNIGSATGTSFNSITALSSTAPIMNGTVSIGTSTTVARADHIHASDTSKANLASPTFTGTVTAPTFIGALSGNSSTATTLATTRTFSATGDATAASQNFNGSANVVLPIVLANSGVTAGSYTKVTVDAKGRTTSGSNPTTLSGYGITDTYTKTEVQNSLPKVGFDLLAATVVSEGELAWNAEDGTLDLGLPNGSTLQIGQEVTRPVFNNSGVLITNGTACKITGTSGNSGRVYIAQSTGLFNESMYVYGIATQDIPNGFAGIVTVSGKVRGINTTGSLSGETWVDNDVLYIKPNDGGKLTKVVPLDNQLKMPVATVINANSNGALEIRVTPINENATVPRAKVLDVPRTISLSGDVTGSVSFDGSANSNIVATIAANSVALGSDTTGNYVAGNTSGTGITVSGTAGEGWSPTISLSNTGTAGTYRSVTTNAQGQVTAGTNPTTISGYAITDAYTKTEVDTKVANLIDSAPSTLDTLNELAAALGDDPNFATTIATSIGTKVTSNTAITAGTGTKITYDAKGLVTAGTILASTDIPVLDTSKITTGILPVLRGGSGVSTSTGTGNNVLSISPVLTTPNIGSATGTSFNSITALSSTAPIMNGTVSIGTSTTVARADHIHASDTSKANLASPTFTGTVTAPTFIGALSGNSSTSTLAASATVLQTARTIGTSGAATGTATTFNGSANITIPITALDASSLTSGTVPDARISGSYTGLTNLTGTGTVDFSKFLGNTSDTVALPSFSWTGDDNTGIYSPAADNLAITTGGVQRALFNASGITGSLVGNASTATTLQTARTIGGVSFNGSANINLPGVNIAGNQSTTGNASTATTLQTARTINGVSFNGSANIVIEDSTKLPLTGGTLTGTIFNNDSSRYWLATATNWGMYWNTTDNALEFHGAGVTKAKIDLDDGVITAPTFIGALSGNAATATKLESIGTTFSGEYPLTVRVSGAEDGKIFSHSTITYNGTSNTLTVPNINATTSVNIGSSQQASIVYNTTESSIDFIIN